MSSSDKELEQQLVDAGNKLLEPPDAVDELLHLLDQVEIYLSKVEQSPVKSMQNAISPSQKALVADQLFKHSDVDVKVAVASCISEITRITAPEAPYDDDQMKEVFQLIVSSFENLSDKSSRSYAKRTLILETVAKVRSCVVMLDLECDALIIEMLQHFLEEIRDDHPENVFLSMETIMNLVLEESEDISPELLFPILDRLKKDNEDVLPIARRLGEKVLQSCATKVKSYLLEAVKSLGISLDDYSEVVASLCQKASVAVEQNDVHEEHMTDDDETPLDEAAQDDKVIVTEAASAEQVAPADNKGPESIVNNGTAQTGEDESLHSNSLKKEEPGNLIDQSKGVEEENNAEPDSSAADKAVKAVDKPEQTTKRKGKKPSSLIKSEEPSDSSLIDSEKEAEAVVDHNSENKEVPSSPHDEPTAEGAVSLEIEKETSNQVSSPKAMEGESMDVASPSPSRGIRNESRAQRHGRTKKKDILLSEGMPSADDVSNQVSSPKAMEGESMDVASPSPSRGIRNESRAQRHGRTKKKDILLSEGMPSADDVSNQVSSPKAMEGESMDVASPSPSRGIRNESRAQRHGRTKKKDILLSEGMPSADDVSKKASEGTSDQEAKPLKRSGRKGLAGSANEDKSPANISKKESGASSDSEAKLSKQSAKNVDASSMNGEESLKKSFYKKRREKAGPGKDATVVSMKEDKEMVSSPKASAKPTKDEQHFEVTSKSNSKRKRTPGKEKASDTENLGEGLVGSKVKVWWPMDDMFYEGVIESFDSIKKKHKVSYDDGDVEILNLKKERWALIGGDSDLQEEKAADREIPESSSEMPLKKKAKTSAAKQVKPENSPKKVGGASSSKSKASDGKSSRKSKDEIKADGKSKDGSKTKSENDNVSNNKDHTPKSNSKSADVATKLASKSKIDAMDTSKSGKSKEGGSGSPKTSSMSKQETQKTGKSKQETAKISSSNVRGKSPKSVGKSNANGTGKSKSSPTKARVDEDVKDSTDTAAKVPENAKGKSPSPLKTPASVSKSGKKRRRGSKS